MCVCVMCARVLERDYIKQTPFTPTMSGSKQIRLRKKDSFLNIKHTPRKFFYRWNVHSDIHTFIKTLITIYIKIRLLLHVTVYDHHQVACN